MMNNLSALSELLNDPLKLLPGDETPPQPGLFTATDVIASTVPLGSTGKVDGIGYVLGGLTFRTKEQATDHMMAIRTKYPSGSFVSDEDARFIVDVVHTHCDAKDKVGHGITRVYIGTCPKAINSKIMFFRLDGSTDDVGKGYVLGGKRGTHERAVKEAMRNAVYPCIEAFRNAAYADGAIPVCGITGEPVPRDQCNVDHAPPMVFSEICYKAAAMVSDDTKVTPQTWEAFEVAKDSAGFFQLTDERCREWFVDLHEDYATLRITLKDANQRAGKHGVRNVQRVEEKLNRSAEDEARVQGQWTRFRQALFVISTAARRDALKQLIDEASGSLASVISGEPLTLSSAAAVFSIERNFDMLMLEWLDRKRLKITDVELVDAPGGGARVMSVELADSFSAFLLSCATFVPASRTEATAANAPVPWVSIRQLVPC